VKILDLLKGSMSLAEVGQSYRKKMNQAPTIFEIKSIIDLVFGEQY
jgi:hypothetical protein